LEAGIGIGKINGPLQKGALVVVENDDGSANRWKVSRFWELDDGGVGHQLEMLPKRPPVPVRVSTTKVSNTVETVDQTSSRCRKTMLSNIDIPKIKINLKSFTVSKAWPFLRKYGMAIAVFLFGLHLHAQARRWGPLWDYGMFGGEVTCKAILFSPMSEEEASSQMVTARWFMILGILIWTGVHYGILEHLKKRRSSQD
jgi:hypothetical protein